MANNDGNAFSNRQQQPLNYGGLGGLNAQADAGYGLAPSFDNALEANTFSGPGHQKMLNDIATGNALAIAQDNQRRADQNYSDQYTQGMIDYFKNTMRDAQAAGAPPEDALRAAIGSFRDTFQGRLSPDSAAQVADVFSSRAKVLAADMLNSNKIDQANSLLQYAGVPGVGVPLLQKYAIQGADQQFDKQLAQAYPDIYKTYDPNSQTYNYGGVKIPRAVAMSFAAQNTPLPVLLNSWAARQLNINNLNPVAGHTQNAEDTPANLFEGQGISSDAMSPTNTIPSGPLADHNKIMTNFVTANIMSQDQKNIDTDLLQPANRGTKTQPSPNYIAQIDKTLSANPYNILRTAYAQADGDARQTAQNVNVVISNLSGSLQDLQLAIEKEQSKSANTRNTVLLGRLTAKRNDTVGMIRSLQAGSQWLQENNTKVIDPASIDPVGTQYGGSVADNVAGVQNRAISVPTMVTPYGGVVPGGYRASTPAQQNWITTAQNVDENALAIRKGGDAFNSNYANPQTVSGSGPMNNISSLVNPIIDTRLNPNQIASIIANANQGNMIRTVSAFELLKRQADAMLRDAKDPATIKRANILKQRATDALAYIQK